MMNTIAPAARRQAGYEPQKVVVVNGDPDILELLETVLDAGRYDMVFVEASVHAYSRIKRVQPHLVILCMELDDLVGFRLLSMLKLDDETRRIPVVTYTNDPEQAPGEEQRSLLDDQDAFPVAGTTITMN
jgi:PleD family two-component response regulator